MVRPPFTSIAQHTIHFQDATLQECAFTITEKKSDIATVLPQRNFATCSLTINLSRLTLDDEDRSEHTKERSDIAVSVTDESSNSSSSSSHNGISIGKILQTYVHSEDNPVESNDAKENVTILAETGTLEEKSVEEPAPKRRRKLTNTEEELAVFSTKDPISP
ncbi:hypothetical protein OSTOST_00842 [Ostertagia ostertagi]